MLHAGVKKILNKLDDDTIMGLVGTVTQGLLKTVKDRDEAVEAILRHSKDEMSLLRRKCITREILFAYAHKNHILVELPATKPDLINAILNFWYPKRKSKTKNKAVSSATQPVCTEGVSVTEGTQTQMKLNDISAMAEQFTQWFYSMLNRPVCLELEHFWNNAEFTIYIIGEDGSLIEKAEGSTVSIINKLFKLKEDYGLFFNPNLVNGVQGKMMPHGLVAIVACGTLLCSNNYAGIFEQMFLLARDPFAENNWKIKKTELNLRKTIALTPPKLTDTSFKLLQLQYT